MIKVVKSSCTFAEYERGEGNAMLVNIFLCKTNSEIKSPNSLIISTNELKNVFGNYQAGSKIFYLNNNIFLVWTNSPTLNW